ncbi:MAG: 2,3-bisphosphoglycerate-independent phosphoglycerate mutase [Dehalococcoidia bacterium]|nr:2,3-bisphosphoglycerate-independent phosphoglycerate mutase [Dehalococcoidia bacterium]
MSKLEQIEKIAILSPSKIALVVIDGLGGLPHPETGKTELETAKTPNLDHLAEKGVCGLIEPLGPGLTPGSGPAHLALFGYDPFQFTIGRGILEALGIDFPLQQGDVAARGNFCTVDSEGVIVDRRAGRISTEECARLCQQLGQIKLDEVKPLVSPVRGHRFLVVFRGNNLYPDISDSDPNQVGLKPNEVMALSPEAEKTAALAGQWVAKARDILANSYPVNMVLLRGFSQHPSFPSMSQVYKVNPVAIATYPMYRGLAKLVGMEVVDVDSDSSIEQEFAILAQHYASYDFFFLHVKQADAAGEDGDFDEKVRVIEEVDAAMPRLTDLQPDVIVVTGDHSTPALLKGHSWHPVPFLLFSRWCRTDDVTEFSERACAKGTLGRFPALEVMPLALANALKLTKFGA